MKINIQKSTPSGRVNAPPSKSVAHRMLICAGLSHGRCTVENVNLSEDIKATLNCLRALGVNFLVSDDKVLFENTTQFNVNEVLNCNESGSTLRFIIPIALSVSGLVTLCGTERLISRGIGVYETLLKESGINFEVGKTTITATGRLKPQKYKIRGDVSSQFITGMMFALPLLNDDSEIEILKPVESRSYIDITLSVLNEFGIEITETAENVFYIKGNQKYHSHNTRVEGDWSNSAFLYALNELGGKVFVDGNNENSKQGDKVCLELFEKLNEKNPVIDLSDCPDLAPIMFAVSAVKNGATFTGTKRLAIKESDRASAMAKELEKFGVTVEVNKNSVKVHGGQFNIPNTELNGHNDHRIVMSLAVLCTLTGGVVNGVEAVKKSFPSFFEVIKGLGVGVSYDS